MTKPRTPLRSSPNTRRSDQANFSSAERTLDDEELDSGDDVDRRDRIQSQPEQELEDTEQKLLDISIPRHPVPQPSDNEVGITAMPAYGPANPDTALPTQGPQVHGI